MLSTFNPRFKTCHGMTGSQLFLTANGTMLEQHQTAKQLAQLYNSYERNVWVSFALFLTFLDCLEKANLLENSLAFLTKLWAANNLRECTSNNTVWKRSSRAVGRRSGFFSKQILMKSCKIHNNRVLVKWFGLDQDGRDEKEDGRDINFPPNPHLYIDG